MAQNWLTGEIPAGFQAPADTQFSAKTDGDVPISEAERIIRKNQERMKAVTGPVGKVFRSLSQIYLNPLPFVNIASNEEAEAMKKAEMQKSKLWREKRDNTKDEIVDLFHTARDAYDKTKDERILDIALQTKDQMLNAAGLSDFDMNPQISKEAYILRDDAGLWTSMPSPYPQAEYLSEAIGGLFGMSKGYSFGEALLAKNYIKNMSKGAAKGFERAKGPWWFKVGGAVIGGAAAVGAADFGYDVMLDMMNGAGKAKENLKDDPNVLKRKIAEVFPEALTFGPRGINRPQFDERWESLKKDVILDASISTAFFGARPLYYGLKSGIGRGIFGMGKKGPGAGAIDPQQLIDTLKSFEKITFNESKQALERVKTLNYSMNVAFGRLDQMLRQIEDKLKDK